MVALERGDDARGGFVQGQPEGQSPESGQNLVTRAGKMIAAL